MAATMMPPTSSFYGFTTPPSPAYHSGPPTMPPTQYNLGTEAVGYGTGYAGEPFPNAFPGGSMPPPTGGWQPPPTSYGNGGMGEPAPTSYGGMGTNYGGWESPPTAYIGHGGGSPGAYPNSMPPDYAPPPTNFNVPGTTSPGGSPEGYGSGSWPNHMWPAAYGGASPTTQNLAPLADHLVQAGREFDSRGYYGYGVAPVRKSTSVWRQNYIAGEDRTAKEAQYVARHDEAHTPSTQTWSPSHDAAHTPTQTWSPSTQTWSPSGGSGHSYDGTVYKPQKAHDKAHESAQDLKPVVKYVSRRLTPRRRRMDCCKTGA